MDERYGIIDTVWALLLAVYSLFMVPVWEPWVVGSVFLVSVGAIAIGFVVVFPLVLLTSILVRSIMGREGEGGVECPHCGSINGTWFDRSMVLDGDGDVLEYENFPTRCIDCGKNIDAPKSYYTDNSSHSCV